jgi:hypothetical protein
MNYSSYNIFFFYYNMPQQKKLKQYFYGTFNIFFNFYFSCAVKIIQYNTVSISVHAQHILQAYCTLIIPQEYRGSQDLLSLKQATTDLV